MRCKGGCLIEKIKDIINLMKLEEKISLTEIFFVWQKVIDEKISSKTCPYFFVRGELFVWVINSLWLHYVTLNKKNLIDTLNKKLGNNFIKNIRFKIGKE